MTDPTDELLATVRLNGAIPAHVAVIMDGNGRWAQARDLPRPAGHQAGMNSVREIVEGGVQAGVSVLTLFAFSQENWQRPPGGDCRVDDAARGVHRQRDLRTPQPRGLGPDPRRPRPPGACRAGCCRPLRRGDRGGAPCSTSTCASPMAAAPNHPRRAQLAARVSAGALAPDAITEDLLWPRSCTPRRGPIPTSSFGPPVNCGSPTSCSGSWPTPSST